MDLLVFIGRVLFVILFLASAFGQLTQTDAMARYVESKGLPAGRRMVLASGVVLLLGGLSILLGVWADLGALLLFLFLAPTAVLMHGFWKESDPQARQDEMIQFQKDIALAGAALLLFAFFAYAGRDLGLMITGPAIRI